MRSKEMQKIRTPTFKGLRPRSGRSSKVARAASKKRNTRCERVLRGELWGRGLRYRLEHAALSCAPDIVFPVQRVVVFCDGDFWHGRNLSHRIAKLERGYNAAYWVAKVKRNVERDGNQTKTLQASGWVVLRYWETDIHRDVSRIADEIEAVLRERPVQGRRNGGPRRGIRSVGM
jgi:DNA mismatch endonuclease (patch repair protein)